MSLVVHGRKQPLWMQWQSPKKLRNIPTSETTVGTLEPHGYTPLSSESRSRAVLIWFQ